MNGESMRKSMRKAVAILTIGCGLTLTLGVITVELANLFGI